MGLKLYFDIGLLVVVIKYLVAFMGYDGSYNKWLRPANLPDSADLMYAY